VQEPIPRRRAPCRTTKWEGARERGQTCGTSLAATRAVVVVLDLHAASPQKNTRPSKPPPRTSRSWPIRRFVYAALPRVHRLRRLSFFSLASNPVLYLSDLLCHFRLVHHHRILLYLLSGVQLNMMFLSWKLNKHRVFQTALVLKQYYFLIFFICRRLVYILQASIYSSKQMLERFSKNTNVWTL
jgi:hypothetical protein